METIPSPSMSFEICGWRFSTFFAFNPEIVLVSGVWFQPFASQIDSADIFLFRFFFFGFVFFFFFDFFEKIQKEKKKKNKKGKPNIKKKKKRKEREKRQVVIDSPQQPKTIKKMLQKLLLVLFLLSLSHQTQYHKATIKLLNIATEAHKEMVKAEAVRDSAQAKHKEQVALTRLAMEVK
jgi:hypothetical protein